MITLEGWEINELDIYAISPIVLSADGIEFFQVHVDNVGVISCFGQAIDEDREKLVEIVRAGGRNLKEIKEKIVKEITQHRLYANSFTVKNKAFSVVANKGGKDYTVTAMQSMIQRDAERRAKKIQDMFV